MDGAATPLRTWEKLYWGIFVAGFSAFLFSRLYRSQPPDPKACCFSSCHVLQNAALRLWQDDKHLSVGMQELLNCLVHWVIPEHSKGALIRLHLRRVKAENRSVFMPDK